MNWVPRTRTVSPATRGEAATAEEVMELVADDGTVVESFTKSSDGSTSASVQTVYSATVTLTDAQIKALPTGAVEMVPAPTNGLSAIPLVGIVTVSLVDEYTNLAANSQLGIVYGDDDKEPLASIFGGLNGILGQSGVRFSLLDVQSDVDGSTTEAMTFSGNPSDYAINLYAYNSTNGAFTGGHADNVLRATVLYTLVEV